MQGRFNGIQKLNHIDRSESVFAAEKDFELVDHLVRGAGRVNLVRDSGLERVDETMRNPALAVLPRDEKVPVHRGTKEEAASVVSLGSSE